MSVKPIDLLTNISQMIEVGKNEHVRSTSLVEQQHHLDKESADKSNLVNSKLEEGKKGEKTAIREDDSNKNRKKGSENSEDKGKRQDESQLKPEKRLSKDERMGRFIDILK